MKVFLVTWGLFCVLVIMGLFIAYATDNLPGVPCSPIPFRGLSINRDRLSWKQSPFRDQRLSVRRVRRI